MKLVTKIVSKGVLDKKESIPFDELESVEVSWEEEKNVSNIDMKHEMKMRNFVQDTDGWRRKFIYITIEEGQMKMGTLISSKNNKLSDIEFKDIDEWIKYFDRI